MLNSKNKESVHSLFIETFILIHKNKRKFIYRLKNINFSIHEKRLLKAFDHFQNNQKKKALELLQTSPIQDIFLEGVRYYLIALVYNQHGHYRYAVENLEKSILRLQQTEYQDFLLNPLCLLVLVLGNRRETEKMKIYLDVLSKIKTKSHHAELQVYQCKILYEIQVNHLDKAEELLGEVDLIDCLELRKFKPHFQILKISLLVKQKKYDACYAVLNEYKKITGVPIVKANYAYVKAMLDHLHLNKPLYIYSSKFKEFPELYFQLQVIKCLSLGDILGAEEYWNLLREHNKVLYGHDFFYNGDESLFSQSLNLYKNRKKINELNLKVLASIKSKLLRLDYLFENITSPISSTDLVELVWGEDANEKSLARLRKLISIYSKERKVKLISRQMTYQICKKSS